MTIRNSPDSPSMTDTSHALNPRALFLLNQVQLSILQRLERGLASVNLTPTLARVLNAIATRPGISSSELAKLFGIAPQSVKQSIGALQGRGFITKSNSEADQRVNELQLTAEGREIWQMHLQTLDAVYKQVFRGLTNREMQTLTRILFKTLTVERPAALQGYVPPSAAGGKKAGQS